MEKDEVIFAGVASTIIGGFTGFGLSFTALSPLVIGGIVSFVAPALLTAVVGGVCCTNFAKKVLLKRVIKSCLPV